MTRPGGTISAIACFCHAGDLPHHHGRCPLAGNHRIDELDLRLDRIWRRTVRPRLLGADHSILNLDLLWQFKAAGLQAVEFDELIALKRARYEYLQGDPARVREVMEVFTEPLLIARGTRPRTALPPCRPSVAGATRRG